jgi:hypothetical protein
MRTFTMGKITAVCRYEKTRSGFRHLATLLVNGCQLQTVKCTYINRTWEKFEYQSVLEVLLRKDTVLTASQKKRFAKKFDLYS